MDRVVRTGGPPAEQALWMAWGSGVFAMVSLIEGVSAVSGSSPLMDDAAAVPWWVSWMAASASAEASAWLTKRAQAAVARRPVEHVPPWERLGGCHPCTCRRCAPAACSCSPASQPPGQHEPEPDSIAVEADELDEALV